MYDFRDKIKELRVQKGLSQTQLVELTGITQASISQIETKKVMPYGVTLKKLSAALDFDFNSILPTTTTKESMSTMTFHDIQKLIEEQDYQSALQLLTEEVTVEDLTNLSNQKHYYYYLGLLEAKVNQDYLVSSFHYLQVICMQKRSLYIEMIDIEAIYGIATNYQLLADFAKASYFYQEALLLVRETKELERSDQIKIIEIYYQWGQTECQLKNDIEALELLEKVIKLALEWDSSVFLGQANLAIAEIYYRQKEKKKADKYLATAKAIAQAYRNQDLLRKLASLK